MKRGIIMVAPNSDQNFLLKWESVRKKGKQYFMVRSTLFLTIYISLLLFIFQTPDLGGTDSIGLWLFSIAWYLFFSMFLSAFLSNLRWKLNERKFNTLLNSNKKGMFE
jgi:uncharacterized membrane protein (DUF485 family)